MKFNHRAIMMYARLLIDMENYGKSMALRQAWRDARYFKRILEREGRYVCTYEVILAPGKKWVTPDEDYEEHNRG